MNEQQYRWLRQNRRFRQAVRLSEPLRAERGGRSPMAAYVAAAARSARRRDAAVVAWERLAAPVWRANTQIAAVDGDTVVIMVLSAALHYELRRQQVALEREVARLAPGLRRLRFVTGGPTPHFDER